MDLYRFSMGSSESYDSPVRETYSQFLKDTGERGKYGYFTKLDSTFMGRLSLPYLPLDERRRNSTISSFTSLSLDGK